MNQDALLRISGLRGVPPKLINLMSEVYSVPESAVRCGDTISELFPVVTAVGQGCVLAPILFSACIDWIPALRVLTERKQEFRQRLLAANVDLCKAFDSVSWDALWRILGLRA